MVCTTFDQSLIGTAELIKPTAQRDKMLVIRNTIGPKPILWPAALVDRAGPISSIGLV